MEPKDTDLLSVTYNHLDLEKILAELPGKLDKMVVSVALTHFRELARRFMLSDNVSVIIDFEDGKTRVRLLWASNFVLAFETRELMQVFESNPMHPNYGKTLHGATTRNRDVRVELNVGEGLKPTEVSVDQFHQAAVEYRVAKIFDYYVNERGMHLLINEDQREANEIEAVDVWPFPCALVLHYTGSAARIVAERAEVGSGDFGL